MPVNTHGCFTVHRTPCCMLLVEFSISSSQQSLEQGIHYPYLPDEKAEVPKVTSKVRQPPARREGSISPGRPAGGGVGPRALAALGRFSLSPGSSSFSCGRGHRQRARSQTPPQVTGAALGLPLCQDHLMRMRLSLPCILQTAPRNRQQ